MEGVLWQQWNKLNEKLPVASLQTSPYHAFLSLKTLHLCISFNETLEIDMGLKLCKSASRHVLTFF